MQEIQKQLKAALEECEKLQKENEKLKSLLREHKISYERSQHKNSLIENAKAEKIKKRIAVFKSLFKGRTDVYPVRWESDDGRSGYSPVCSNKWNPTLCDIRKTKCKNCQNSAYIPITDGAIYKHLSGKHTIGIYSLLQDGTCYFLAVDFDKKDWQKDVRLFINTCRDYNIPAAIERSRSGNGCHVWFFFDEAIPAALARKFGKVLLEKTSRQHNLSALNSYDRMFPTQDFLTPGGLGNLIALPLQGIPRKHGNSVFVNESFEPFQDQWAYLTKLRKTSKNDLQSFLSMLDTVVIEKPPKNTMPTKIPDKITIQLQNGIIFSKSELPTDLAKQFWKLSSFSNPAYYKARAQRRSTNNISRKIICSDQTESEFIFPRGCLEEIRGILQDNSVTFDLLDHRKNKPITDITFNGSLLPQQQEALENLLEHSTGILMATTGFGKTTLEKYLKYVG